MNQFENKAEKQELGGLWYQLAATSTYDIRKRTEEKFEGEPSMHLTKDAVKWLKTDFKKFTSNCGTRFAHSIGGTTHHGLFLAYTETDSAGPKAEIVPFIFGFGEKEEADFDKKVKDLRDNGLLTCSVQSEYDWKEISYKSAECAEKIKTAEQLLTSVFQKSFKTAPGVVRAFGESLVYTLAADSSEKWSVQGSDDFNSFSKAKFEYPSMALHLNMERIEILKDEISRAESSRISDKEKKLIEKNQKELAGIEAENVRLRHALNKMTQ